MIHGWNGTLERDDEGWPVKRESVLLRVLIFVCLGVAMVQVFAIIELRKAIDRLQPQQEQTEAM